MKTTITKQELLQLEGIKVLAKKYSEYLEDLKEQVRGITGEEDDHGHSSDFTYYDDISTKELLRKLKIKVKK